MDSIQLLTFEESKSGNDSRGRNVNCELILPDRELLHIFGKAAHHPGAIAVQVISFALVLVGRVHNRRLQFTNVITGRLSHVLGFVWHRDQPGGRAGDGAGDLDIASLKGLFRWTQSGSQRAASGDFGCHGQFCALERPIDGQVIGLVVWDVRTTPG